MFHSETSEPLSRETVRRLAAEVLAPAHFFTASGLRLEGDHVAREELVWEIFRGRILDPAHTRQRRTFEAWNVYQVGAEGRSAEPLLSLKLDEDGWRLYVVRGLECYVWEGYDSGGGVILSRERRKWVRELVGTIELGRFATAADLRDELACQFFHAVAGHRLPLTSVEAPLPAFSFGQLFYCYRPGVGAGPSLSIWQGLTEEMLTNSLAWLEKTKLLETFLHAVSANEISEAASLFTARWASLGHTPADLAALLRSLYNEVSLTPYTDLEDKTLAFLDALERQGTLDAAAVADFLSYLLCQLSRHLTAYDLMTFHHRGANYPDALLLDAVLKVYQARIERHPELFLDSPDDGEGSLRAKRLRRRALRQGWLLRRRYENHPVPDVPTSPGENNRVLPPSHPRVPEEQILQPTRRSRRLYANDPLTKYLGESATEALRQSVADLNNPSERRELGLALFLDRPLGEGRAPGEPDATPLLSCQAYSRAIAEQRLRDLAREEVLTDGVRGLPEAPAVAGLPLDAIGTTPRPGVVSLADARQASPDFVFLRTTAASLQDLLDLFDFTPMAASCDIGFLTVQRRALVARSAKGTGIVVYDEQFRPRLELEVAIEQGYATRAGCEFPGGGLRLVRAWDEGGAEVTLPEPVPLPVRD
jgi:hypothetical protein